MVPIIVAISLKQKSWPDHGAFKTLIAVRMGDLRATSTYKYLLFKT